MTADTRKREPDKRIETRLLAISGGVISVAMAVLLVIVFMAFEDQLGSAVRDKTTVLSRVIGHDLERAVELGIPLRELRGVDELFGTTIAEHDELSAIALVDAEGVPVSHVSSQLEPSSRAARSGDGSSIDRPIALPDERAARLTLAIDGRYAERQLRAIIGDLLIVLFVALLATRESVQFLVGRAIAHPGRAATRPTTGRAARSKGLLTRLSRMTPRRVQPLHRAAGPIAEDAAEGPAGDPVQAQARSTLSAIRFPVFVFFFGLELPRAFFPMFVGSLYQPIPYLSQEVAIALPMSAWVIAVILATPLAGWLYRRTGGRRALLIGMLPTIAGMALTATASSVLEVILWRTVAGAGCGLVTVAAMIYAAELSSSNARARGMGVFFAATISASVCATAIGGLLADRIGFRPTFLVGAMLIAAAMLLVHRFVQGGRQPDGHATAKKAGEKKPIGHAWFRLLLDWRFAAFMLLSAIPARMALTGLFFYLTPLFLVSLEYNEAAIGRMMMMFFIAMLVLIPVTARWADGLGAHRSLLAGGAALSAAGALVLAAAPHIEFGTQVWVLVLGVAMVGAGHCTSRAPQIAYLPIAFERLVSKQGREGMIVAFRMIERFGSVGGPIGAAVLAETMGYAAAAQVLGIVLLVAAIGLALLLLSLPCARSIDVH